MISIAKQEARQILNFEYLAIYLCAYDLECDQSMIPLSPPTSHSMHSTCIQHATTWLINGGIFFTPFSASQSSETQSSATHAEIVLAAHIDLLPKGSVKHVAMSKSLLKEGMLAYHITAAIPLPELTSLLP